VQVRDRHSLVDSINDVDIVEVNAIAQCVEQVPLRIRARVGEQEFKLLQSHVGKALVAAKYGNDSGE
jgi:hypothetical protein